MKKIPNMRYVPNCCYYSLKLELFDYNRYFSDFGEAWNYQKNKKISDIQKNPKIQNFQNWFFQLSEYGIFSFWEMTSISPYFSKNNNFRKYIDSRYRKSSKLNNSFIWRWYLFILSIIVQIALKSTKPPEWSPHDL